MRLLRFLAVAALIVGAAATVWATTELQGGVSELPNHWWSTAPVLLLGLGAAAALAAQRLQR